MATPDKKCTYTLPNHWPAPKAGQYLATFNYKGDKLKQVWLIHSVRQINHKLPRLEQGYAIVAYDRSDLIALTEWADEWNDKLDTWYRFTWVRGEEALPCFSWPWKKKDQEQNLRS
ncbi:hypothetical protein [Fibrella forsythiae]|uniref:Uncharacterized protein n=1 Tax=Fibrella forsythiae TaxID=2817061 RepID=A0ABS3JC29_9BACT|nr:hypothetical protein [Fibrella forsythiae]MBO0947535.1 hypothetical protein [Fibrella forsythiae]